MIQHVATAEGTYLFQLLTFQGKISKAKDLVLGSFGFNIPWISRMLANCCGPEMNRGLEEISQT
jgi:hypothetical protein